MYKPNTAPVRREHERFAIERATQALSIEVERTRLVEQIDAWVRGTADLVIAAIDAKDTYTRGHSERVSRFSVVIGERMGLDQRQLRDLRVSALCHDIGKIGVSDAVLKKPGLLSIDEFEEMKQHPRLGGEMISYLPNADDIIGGIKHHHERWDGTGYPDNLMGEAIPLFARIIAIADAFDAMISGRSYSGFMTEQRAIERFREISECFDPVAIDALYKAYADGALSLRTGTIQNIRVPKR